MCQLAHRCLPSPRPNAEGVPTCTICTSLLTPSFFDNDTRHLCFAHPFYFATSVYLSWAYSDY